MAVGRSSSKTRSVARTPRRTTSRGSGRALFSHVPPDSVRHLSYYGRLTRRGRYRFGPLRISTRFPLGLIRRTVTVEQTQTMTVCPRLGHLTPGLDEPPPADPAREPQDTAAAKQPGDRVLRRSRLAERRQPQVDSLADFGPPRQPGGPPVGAAATSGRAPAARPLAASPADTGAACHGRTGGQFCRHGGRRSMPPGWQPTRCWGGRHRS